MLDMKKIVVDLIGLGSAVLSTPLGVPSPVIFLNDYSRACLIYTFSLSFSSSFTFQTGKFTSSYIFNSNDKLNVTSNDRMLSVQMPFAVSQKR